MKNLGFCTTGRRVITRVKNTSYTRVIFTSFLRGKNTSFTRVFFTSFLRGNNPSFTRVFFTFFSPVNNLSYTRVFYTTFSRVNNLSSTCVFYTIFSVSITRVEAGYFTGVSTVAHTVYSCIVLVIYFYFLCQFASLKNKKFVIFHNFIVA